jgi:hypothetical protein
MTTSRRAAGCCVIVAMAAATSGCAFYWKGGAHPHWVPTVAEAPRARCEHLPEVYARQAPAHPYRSLGIIQVLSIAKSVIFGKVNMPNKEEIMTALQEKGCELGCDVLVGRSIHRVFIGGEVTPKVSAGPHLAWSFAQFSTQYPQFPAPSLPPQHFPMHFPDPPPPEVDEFQFVCGILVDTTEQTAAPFEQPIMRADLKGPVPAGRDTAAESPPPENFFCAAGPYALSSLHGW